eukprot:scaffold39639_cov72-Phaeocystis_antarctica.AAC.1
MRRDDEPFFSNPRLFPEGTRSVAAAAKVRDATGAWTYSMALTASYAMQRLVGLLQGEELGFMACGSSIRGGVFVRPDFNPGAECTIFE